MSADLEKLQQYSACEIADALLALGVPGAGFLPDIAPINTGRKVVAPATTVLFVPRTSSSFPDFPVRERTAVANSNIPSNGIYADMVSPRTIVVISQPKGAATATMGGLMAARMCRIGIEGVLVDGRVRDIKQLRELVSMPVWAKGTSIVATRGQCRAHAINIPIEIGSAQVEEGDIIMLDPQDTCAVCIPKSKLAEVLEMVSKLAAEDETKMARVLGGMKIEDAIKKSM